MKMRIAERAALVLFLMVATVFVGDLIRERLARATANSVTLNKDICTGTAASAGGTGTCTFGIATDTGVHIIADVAMSELDAGHLWGVAGFSCDAVFENDNGTMGTATAMAASPNTATNPVAAIGTSTTAVYQRTSRAEGADSMFVNSGSGLPPNCAWTTNASHQAVLTVTNNGASGTADFTAYVTQFVFGSH